MGEVRLLHLSDFHFCRRPNNRDLVSRLRTDVLSFFKVYAFEEKINRFASHQPQLADALAEFVYVNRDGLDAIIITGDVATTGLETDLALAASYITDECTKKWWTAREVSGLNSRELPIFVLPGNHDRYCNEIGTAGGTDFENYFGPYWPADSRVNTFPLVTPDHEQLAIVAADFTLREDDDGGASPLFRYGRGKVYADTITELISETRRLHRRGCTAVIWATHFPIKPPREAWSSGMENWSLALLGENQLVSAAKTCGVHHVLAGHIHRKERYRIPGENIEIFCAASSLAVASVPNEIHVMTIHVTNGSISSVEFRDHIYDQVSQAFV